MINRMVLQGRFTRDPELRTTNSGVAMLTGSIAWSEKYKDKETVLFLRIKAWRGTAEFIQKYFTKGQEIVVEGSLSTHEWEDDGGNKRSLIEMTVDKAHFCGPKGGGSVTSSAPPMDEIPGFEDIDEDELPF